MTNQMPSPQDPAQELDQAKLVLEVEANGILAARDRLDGSFIKALDLVTTAIQSGGKIVVIGVGKSGKVASKVAATLSSTGTLAIFLHPTEAAHGDLGIVSPQDALLIFSHSGNSEEVLRLMPSFRRIGIKIISVVGNLNSALARQSDVVLNGEITKEACPLNLAPSTSTTVAIALGDALALTLSSRWDFKEDHFANIHPGGALGRRLTLLVSDLMKKGGELAWISTDAGMEDVVAASTEKHLGGVLVQSGGVFVGLITDGDIRRALKHKTKFFSLKAGDVMTKNPAHIAPHEKARRALELMENRPSQISVLPVLETDPATGAPRCVGLLRLHDLIGQL